MEKKNNQEVPTSKGTRTIILYCCILVLLATNVFLGLKVESLSNQIKELSNTMGCTFDSGKEDEKLDAAIKQSEDFKNSEYYQSHLIDASGKRKDIFTVMDDTYYILFSRDDCKPCMELEAVLDGKDLSSINLFFMNASDFDENTEIQMEDGEIINEYETTVEEFNVRATPSLLKINGNRCFVFIGMRSILNELNIQ